MKDHETRTITQAPVEVAAHLIDEAVSGNSNGGARDRWGSVAPNTVVAHHEVSELKSHRW